MYVSDTKLCQNHAEHTGTENAISKQISISGLLVTINFTNNCYIVVDGCFYKLLLRGISDKSSWKFLKVVYCDVIVFPKHVTNVMFHRYCRKKNIIIKINILFPNNADYPVL